MSSGLTCGDVEVRVVRADSRFRSVHVRDLPSEVSDEDVKSFFQSYGQVLSVRPSTFANFPAIYNGYRVLEMALGRDIPYLISFGDSNCRVWYPRQPVYCVICRKTGHRCPSCPLSGLCRRCCQPGHLARECRQAWGAIDPGTEDLYDSILAAEDDGSSDYVPPEEACSEASEGVEEDQLMSGDEEVVTSAAPPPPPSPPSAPVSAPVPDVPNAPPVLSPVSDSPASVPSPVCDVKASVPPAPLVSSAVPPASPVSVSPDAVPCPVPSISASDAVSGPPRVSSVASSPVDPCVVASLRDIPHREFLTFDVANFVTVSIEKFRFHPASYSALTDYVSSFQRNVLKKMSSSKKPLKRPPAKLLDSEGPPARKPTRPDRVK